MQRGNERIQCRLYSLELRCGSSSIKLSWNGRAGKWSSVDTSYTYTPAELQQKMGILQSVEVTKSLDQIPLRLERIKDGWQGQDVMQRTVTLGESEVIKALGKV
jgi:hypothetical protein